MKIHAFYRVFQHYFRPRRMTQFVDMFCVKNDTSIIDVGGDTTNWSYISVKPKVLVGNIATEDHDEGQFSFRKIDGTKLPFGDESFDIAYSNSVIEHVGNWDKQVKFADEVRRVAKYYYVQTPNRWFFIEPHFITPFIHLLPRPLFRRLLPFFSMWYWVQRPTPQEVTDIMEEIKLLDKAQMRELFPDAQLIEEKFMFFTKSLIAVRAPPRS